MEKKYSRPRSDCWPGSVPETQWPRPRCAHRWVWQTAPAGHLAIVRRPRLMHAREDFHQCGLAGAVFAEQRVDAASEDFKRDIFLSASTLPKDLAILRASSSTSGDGMVTATPVRSASRQPGHGRRRYGTPGPVSGTWRCTRPALPVCFSARFFLHRSALRYRPPARPFFSGYWRITATKVGSLSTVLRASCIPSKPITLILPALPADLTASVAASAASSPKPKKCR